MCAGDVEDRLKAQPMPSKVGLDDLTATVNNLFDEAKIEAKRVPTRWVTSKTSGRTLVEKLLIKSNMTLFCVCNRSVHVLPKTLLHKLTSLVADSRQSTTKPCLAIRRQGHSNYFVHIRLQVGHRCGGHLGKHIPSKLSPSPVSHG